MKIVVCENKKNCSLAKSNIDQSVKIGYPGKCPECNKDLIKCYKLSQKQLIITSLAALLAIAIPLSLILFPTQQEYVEQVFILNHPPDTVIILSTDSYADTIGPFASNHKECKFQWQVVHVSKGIKTTAQSGEDSIIVNHYSLDGNMGTVTYIITPIVAGYPNTSIEFNRIIKRKSTNIKTSDFQMPSAETSIAIPALKYGQDTIWELNTQKSYGVANIESVPKQGAGKINVGVINVEENLSKAEIAYKVYTQKNNKIEYIGDHIIVINNVKKVLSLNNTKLTFSGQENILIPPSPLIFNPVQPDKVSWAINKNESVNIDNIEQLKQKGAGELPEFKIKLIKGREKGTLVFDVQATKKGYNPYRGTVTIECKAVPPRRSLELIKNYSFEQGSESGFALPSDFLQFKPSPPQTIQWTLLIEKSSGIENILQLPGSGTSIQIHGTPRISNNIDAGKLVYKITAANNGFEPLETEINVNIHRAKLKELKFIGVKTFSNNSPDIPKYTFKFSPQINSANIHWKLNKSETKGLKNTNILPQEGDGIIPAFSVEFSDDVNSTTIVYDFEASQPGFIRFKDKIRYTVTSMPDITLVKKQIVIQISANAKTITIPKQNLVFSPKNISTANWVLNRQESENINSVTGILQKGVGAKIDEMQLALNNITGNIILVYDIQCEKSGFKPLKTTYLIKLERAPCPTDVDKFNNDAENNMHDLREHIFSLMQINNPVDQEIWVEKAKKSFGKLTQTKIDITIEGYPDFSSYINRVSKLPTIKKQFDGCNKLEKIIIQP